MSDATTYSEEQFIGRSFEGTDTDSAPSTVYVALWEQAPANSPDNSFEVGGDSYTVQGVGNADWSRAQTGDPTEVENAVEIDFGVLDSSTTTPIEGLVLFDGSDTSTANALYATGDISESVAAGNEFKINANDASFQIS